MVSPGLASLAGVVVGLIVLAVGITRFGYGIDGIWSLANIQLVIWTGVVLGSYVALSLAAGGFISEVPNNTLVLIGISSATLPASAIIRATQEKKGHRGAVKKEGIVKKTDGTTVKLFFGGFLAAEKTPEHPSLAKMQMFAWNVVAAFLFVAFVATNMKNGAYQLPDVGATLSTIIGISNGTYVANKAADTPA